MRRSSFCELPFNSVKPLGALCLCDCGYLTLSATRYKTFRLFEWEFPVPSTRLALAQLLVAVVDWTAAAAVLYVLLPPGYGLAFLPVLGVFYSRNSRNS